MLDHRRTNRASLRAMATCYVESRELLGLVTDWSDHGCFFACESALETDTEIELDLPGNAGRVKGRVARSAGPKDDHVGFGIEFAAPMPLPVD